MTCDLLKWWIALKYSANDMGNFSLFLQAKLTGILINDNWHFHNALNWERERDRTYTIVGYALEHELPPGHFRVPFSLKSHVATKTASAEKLKFVHGRLLTQSAAWHRVNEWMESGRMSKFIGKSSIIVVRERLSGVVSSINLLILIDDRRVWHTR